MLTKEKILEADDLKTEKVEVPEWGGAVCIRTLTGAERDAFEQGSIETKGKSTKVNLANIRARLCALSIVDEKGDRLFDAAEAARLGHKSAKALDRIFAKSQELSGLSDKDVEDLTKNSETDPNADSTSN